MVGRGWLSQFFGITIRIISIIIIVIIVIIIIVIIAIIIFGVGVFFPVNPKISIYITIARDGLGLTGIGIFDILSFTPEIVHVGERLEFEIKESCLLQNSGLFNLLKTLFNPLPPVCSVLNGTFS